MATTTLATNLTLTVVGSTAALTIAGAVTTVSYNLSILCSLDPAATLSFVLEISKDGGTTYSAFVQETFQGGPAAKVGGAATQIVSGEIDKLAVGNKLRGRIVAIASGAGIWKVPTASITQS